MRPRYLALAAAAVAAALTTTAVSPAVAGPTVPADGWPSWAVTGTLYRSAPLYPESPDGWVCHFGGECRPARVRYADDPEPIMTLPKGQRVRVRCAFGNYAWAEVEPDRDVIGWVEQDAMSYSGGADSCGLADWALGWRRWG